MPPSDNKTTLLPSSTDSRPCGEGNASSSSCPQEPFSSGNMKAKVDEENIGKSMIRK